MKTIKGYQFNTGKGFTYQRTPAARLAFFKHESDMGGPKDWRAVRSRFYAPEVSPLSPGFNSKDYGVRKERTPVMLAYKAGQFRAEQWADECEEAGRTIEHSGWFSDADCSRTLRAFVFRLPHGRWGCGYADSDSGERVYLLEVHQDAKSAARSADHEAQHYAEEEKEYNERWHAAQDWQSDVFSKRKEVREGLALRNNPAFEYIREEVRADIEKLRDLYEKAEDHAEFSEEFPIN